MSRVSTLINLNVVCPPFPYRNRRVIYVTRRIEYSSNSEPRHMYVYVYIYIYIHRLIILIINLKSKKEKTIS